MIKAIHINHIVGYQPSMNHHYLAIIHHQFTSKPSRYTIKPSIRPLVNHHQPPSTQPPQVINITNHYQPIINHHIDPMASPSSAIIHHLRWRPRRLSCARSCGSRRHRRLAWAAKLSRKPRCARDLPLDLPGWPGVVVFRSQLGHDWTESGVVGQYIDHQKTGRWTSQ